MALLLADPEPVELLLLVAGQLPGDVPEALPHRKPGEREPPREPPTPASVRSVQGSRFSTQLASQGVGLRGGVRQLDEV